MGNKAEKPNGAGSNAGAGRPSMPTLSSRIEGALWGLIVGDALGVPVEFRSRSELEEDPVEDMRGWEVHDQPMGTWSDDSSVRWIVSFEPAGIWGIWGSASANGCTRGTSLPRERCSMWGERRSWHLPGYGWGFPR